MRFATKVITAVCIAGAFAANAVLRGAGVEAAASGPSGVNAQIRLVGQPIVIAGESSYCAFADLVRLTGGDLLVVYVAAGGHSDANTAIQTRRSADDGKTWGPARTALTSVGSACGVRDPHIVQLPEGTLLLSYFLDPAVNDGSAFRPSLVRSADQGLTWGKPEPIAMPASAVWLATGGKVFTPQNGELLLPVYGRFKADAGERAGLLRSRDGGKSWGDFVTVATAGTAGVAECNEMELAALADGSLVALIRPGLRVLSRDHGHTWGKAEATVRLHAPGLLADGPRLWMNHRTNGYGSAAVSVSFDGGKTWPASEELCGPAGADCAYGAIVRVRGGSPGPYFTVYYAPYDGSVKILGRYFRLMGVPDEVDSVLPSGRAPGNGQLGRQVANTWWTSAWVVWSGVIGVVALFALVVGKKRKAKERKTGRDSI